MVLQVFADTAMLLAMDLAPEIIERRVKQLSREYPRGAGFDALPRDEEPAVHYSLHDALPTVVFADVPLADKQHVCGPLAPKVGDTVDEEKGCPPHAVRMISNWTTTSDARSSISRQSFAISARP